MKHRPRSERAGPSEASSTTDESVVDDDGAKLGRGPHHDPTIHVDREPFAVTSQRCRGEYP
jgi:hypothetical protein